MKFTARSEQELLDDLLLKPGKYPFHVIDAVTHVSAKQVEMIKLTVKIEDGKRSFLISDYLTPNMPFKLIHFCKVGKLDHFYDNGELMPYHCKGIMGMCEIIVQKSDDPKYFDRNAIKDYVKQEEIKFDTDLNDEIPF